MQTKYNIYLLIAWQSVNYIMAQYNEVLGHIASRDPIMDYTNAGFMSNIGFPFKLTSGLV